MLKFKLALPFHSLLLPSLSHNRHRYPRIPLLFLIQDRSYSSTPRPSCKKFVLVDFLTNSLKFPTTKAIAVSNRVPHINSYEKPEAVVCFFRTLGFSDTQIQSSVQVQPSLLVSNVETNHKPKITFFQELGLSGPQLGRIISKNPSFLRRSLDKKLKPHMEVIKEALECDGSENRIKFNDLMFHILTRFPWIKGEESIWRSNITYLRSCGVVGPQLIMLLKNVPRLFSLTEEQLKLLISRASEMGFVMGSGMFAYGISALYSNSADTISRKVEVLRRFGFSRYECNEVLVKAPTLIKASEDKIRCGLEFFLHTVMLEKSMLLRLPHVLTLSFEKRVIPRYKLLETMKSSSLLKKEPNFITVVLLSEKMFVEKYILRFADYSKVLQVAYENHLLESS